MIAVYINRIESQQYCEVNPSLQTCCSHDSVSLAGSGYVVAELKHLKMYERHRLNLPELSLVCCRYIVCGYEM